MVNDEDKIQQTDKALAQHKQFMKDHRETYGSEMGSEWSAETRKGRRKNDKI